MTHFQFIVLSCFVITCILVTYLNSRKLILVRKQRDRLAQCLLSLKNNVEWIYPEGIHEDEDVMREATKALQEVVNSEK